MESNSIDREEEKSYIWEIANTTLLTEKMSDSAAHEKLESL